MSEREREGKGKGKESIWESLRFSKDEKCTSTSKYFAFASNLHTLPLLLNKKNDKMLITAALQAESKTCIQHSHTKAAIGILFAGFYTNWPLARDFFPCPSPNAVVRERESEWLSEALGGKTAWTKKKNAVANKNCNQSFMLSIVQI